MSPPLTERDLLAYYLDMKRMARLQVRADIEQLEAFAEAVHAHEQRMGMTPSAAWCSTVVLERLLLEIKEKWGTEVALPERGFVGTLMVRPGGVDLWHEPEQQEPIVFSERAPLAEGMEGGE